MEVLVSANDSHGSNHGRDGNAARAERPRIGTIAAVSADLVLPTANPDDIRLYGRSGIQAASLTGKALVGSRCDDHSRLSHAGCAVGNGMIPEDTGIGSLRSGKAGRRAVICMSLRTHGLSCIA
jgi:hypothetical protein